MELHRFIREQMETILSEWEEFARTLSPGADELDGLALRDHAKQMLLAIATDLETYQSDAQRDRKSQGLALAAVRDTAATIHGALRFSSQFTMQQLGAEFRALRATVLRLWVPQGGADELCGSIIRFNEAIDQALAESVDAFAAKADAARELFLAMLGHDLRAPLATLGAAGEVLGRAPLDATQSAALGGSVKRAVRHMAGMIDNLIGYTRLQLGGGMSLQRVEIDLLSLCRDAIEDAKAAFPGSVFELEHDGERSGRFDAVGLRQLMTNLLVNAAQHGLRGRPIQVELRVSPERLALAVSNEGPAIPEAARATIFRALVQLGSADDPDASRTSLGLGLFIAQAFTALHDGEISVESVDGRTTFHVDLPMHAPS